MNRPYTPQNGINWVQGIEGAKAWQLAPNSNIMLLDSENEGRFYIKTSDNVGMCNLRIFEYSEVTNAPTENAIDLSEYVTREELNNALAKIGGNKNEQPVQSNKSSKHVITK